MIHDLAVYVAGIISGLVITAVLAYGWWVITALERTES